MQKNQAYHEAAIDYNRRLAECAEGMAPDLGHEEVQRWANAVGKQHRFHEKRHQSSLNKLLAPTVEESAEESSEEAVPAPSEATSEITPEQTPPVPEALVEQVEADPVEVPQDSGVSTSDASPATEIIQEAPADETLADGCVKFHNPSDPNCEFSPATGGSNA